MWLGSPTSTEARCTACSDRVYHEQAHRWDRLGYAFIVLAALGLLVAALLPRAR
jgi:uncharacterized paraquat-inducible protein A